MPAVIINPTYFNFITRNTSAREGQGATGSLNLIKGDQFGGGTLGTDFEVISDQIDYDQANGKLTISRSGGYEVIAHINNLNVGGNDAQDNLHLGFNRPDAHGVRLLIYKNDALAYDGRQAAVIDDDGAKMTTFRHVLCCEAGDELRIHFQADGNGIIMTRPGTQIIVHRLMNRFGSITLSGSTRPWKDANPLTASLLQDSPPTIAETNLNFVGYDNTHGRLVSSGSDPNLLENGGIFNISFNPIVGSSSFNQTHITASINDVEIYNTKFRNIFDEDPGPSRQISLIRPLNTGDYVSMFLKDKGGSEVGPVTVSETPSSNTLQSGSCFTITEIGHGNAYVSLSITAASASFVSGGVSKINRTSTTGAYLNVWNIHNGIVWDSNLISSATVTEHMPSKNITWNQGGGDFTVELPGIYYVAALTNVRNDSGNPGTPRHCQAQLFVNSVTHISQTVYVEAFRSTSRGVNQSYFGNGIDIITLLSLSAGDSVSLGHRLVRFGGDGAGEMRFGGGTIFTMYRLGLQQDWAFDESNEEIIQSNYTLKTNISASKRDVSQPPFASMVRGPMSLRGRTRLSDETDAECGTDSLGAGEMFVPDRDAAGVRPFCYKKISKD